MAQLALPFALSHLEVLDFQGIKQLKIENLPLHKKWIFITGENAFGKTSVLKAIAKGIVGDEEFIEWLPAQSQLRVRGTSWGKPFQHAPKPKVTATHEFQLAAYGVSRLRMMNMDWVEPTHNRISKKTYSLFKDDLLLNIERTFMDTEKDDPTTFNQLTAIFCKLIPRLAKIECKLLNKRKWVLYSERGDDGEIYNPVFLQDLAAGYRSILTMVGDMILRLSEHPNNSLHDLQGLVLIDEFDAHLHPKYQYELPQLLSETFPKIQFIVATHSPIPILGANPAESIVLTVHRDKTNGITIERLDNEIDLQSLTANSLLTSDIFDFNHIFARGATPSNVVALDDYAQIKEMKRLEKLLQLKNGLNGLNIHRL
jgi:predicted ATP-binding protein involved in virulence